MRARSEHDPVVNELKQIKRLLALILVRDGAPQQPVAKAAGIRAATINTLAQRIGKSSKNNNGAMKG